MSQLDSSLVGVQLAKIIASPVFARGEQACALLRYVVEEVLAGRTDGLKENLIGVHVFRRPADWNPKTDSTVRMQAGRLRDKLREYYATIGQNDPLVIEIPKGAYVPRWQIVERTPRRLPRKALTAACVALTICAAALLWWFFVRQEIRSVAVLPLRNPDGNAANEPLADGLTEDLIRYLSGLHNLRVISPTSSFILKGKNKTLREIGALLDVQAVVEGTLRRDGPQVRVQVQLTRVSDERVLWAGAFARESNRLLSLQNELALAVVNTLRPTLNPMIAAAGSPMDPEAYQRYLQGLAAFRLWTNESLLEAIGYFEQAMEKDPRSVLPLATLVRSYNRMGLSGQLPRREAAEKMRAAARRGLEIDARSGDAHASMGKVYWSVDHDAKAAEDEFRSGRQWS